MLHQQYTHINDYAHALFGRHEHLGLIIRFDDTTYSEWDLESECGQRCRDVLLAAYTFYMLTHDADERSTILQIAWQQCRVICYS